MPTYLFAVIDRAVMVAAHRRHHRAAACPGGHENMHMASHTSMKDSGPDASAPTPFTAAPFGRSELKS